MPLIGYRGLVPARAASSGRDRIVPYQQRARSFGGMYLLHFLLAACAAFGAQVVPSAAWAYVALAIYLSLCLGILRTSPATFLLFVPLLANRLTEFISGGAIESGAYMIETNTTGHATGAFARLLLIYILFLFTATAAVEAMWPRLNAMFRDAPARWSRQAKPVWIGLVMLVIVVSLYLAWLGVKNGAPLFNGTDRFTYMRSVEAPLYRSWMSNRLVFVPFIGVLFTLPAYRVRAGLIILWLLMTSIIFGEKFGSILMILSVVGIPVGLVHIANDRKIPINFIAAIGAAIVVITIPAVLIAYGAMTDFDAAAERYGQRVALQGQLWYVTDLRYLSATNFDDRALAADMATWLDPRAQDSTKAGTRFGLYYVMQRFASSRILGWTMDGGNGFIGSLYPYLMMTMGVVGMLIVSSIIALYHAVLMRMLAASFAQSIWLAALLYSRVMSSFYATYTTGYLWNIFGIKTIATLLLALFLSWEYGRSTSISRRFLARGRESTVQSRRTTMQGRWG